MTLVIISAMLFAYFLFLTAVHPLIKSRERIERRVRTLQATEPDSLDEELSKPFSERFVRPVLFRLLRAVSRLSPKQNGGSMDKLRGDLRMGGIAVEADSFSALKWILLLGMLLFGAIIAALVPLTLPIRLLILLIGVILGILIPRYYLKSKIKKRQKSIRQAMPDVMDLLSVSVEAGLGFDAALLRVGERSNGPLVEELMAVYREIQMGRPRRDALKSMGKRSGVEELKSFCAAMTQAEQLGISIRNVLRAQSDQLRLKRRQNAEEKALKAPIKMIIPLVIFIFPVIFIILLVPAVLRIVNML